VLAHLAHLADLAHGALVLGMVLGAVKRALLVRSAAVDRGVTGGANFELGELVELDVHRIMRVPLALSLRLAGLLVDNISPGAYSLCDTRKGQLTLSRILWAPPFARIRFAKLRAEL